MVLLHLLNNDRLGVMKKTISITIDEAVYRAISNKPNVSKLFNDLVLDSLASEHRDSIVLQVKNSLMADEEFLSYIVDRISASGAAPVSAPTPDIKPNPYANAPVAVGYACCKLKNPCNHWQWDGNAGARVNTVTGEVRVAYE